jgi:hypothetical protein
MFCETDLGEVAWEEVPLTKNAALPGWAVLPI